MTAAECLRDARRAGPSYQRVINAFVDEFRRQSPDARHALLEDPIEASGPLEGLVAGVVSALCREVSLEPPEWVGRTWSPEPFFPFPAESFAMRLRLMIESPPPFRIRRVFVPENYLSRAQPALEKDFLHCGAGRFCPVASRRCPRHTAARGDGAKRSAP